MSPKTHGLWWPLLAMVLVSIGACGGSSSGPSVVSTPSPPLPSPSPQCADGTDNDSDGAVDLADAGCSGATDDDESDDPPPPPPPPPPVGSGGLDERPSNLTCVAPDKTGAGSTLVDTLDAFPALPSLSRPVALLQAPGDDSRWFVVEQAGRVRTFANAESVASLQTFIDIRAQVDSGPNEAGLLGMAFHPDFAANGAVFLSYTATGSPLVSVVSRFTSPDGGLSLAPGSEQVVLTLNQDFGNHNGGHIAFGPDGYLYVGFGDGGNGGDPRSRAQDTTNLLGAMLRIDVDGGAPYGIPPDNPFAGNPRCPADPDGSAQDCPEIYAWGLRNPWRWSFDRDTGELWLGDVGQGAWEEVDRIERGGNYGWDCREGAHAFGQPAASCATATGLIDPVAEYDHGEGRSITGGYVYRGAGIPALIGRYVYADFITGRLWALDDDGQGGFIPEQLAAALGFNVPAFGEGNDGELYVLDFGGRVRRLTDGSGGSGLPPLPELLSDTGCVDTLDPTLPAGGLIPYSVQAPFWSDGATKQRWLAIPDGTTVSVDGAGDFRFPNGTVLMKHFRLSGQLIETRLFMRHPDGDWAGYSYEWDAQQTDATLVQGGRVERLSGQDWVYPSGTDCMVCHTQVAGFSLGLEVAQLNGDFTYAGTGRTANQLLTLDAIAMFGSPLGDPSLLATLPEPTDAGEALQDRARAYLHTNCAQCHRPGGPTPTNLDLRFDIALAVTNICDVQPQTGSLGIADARILAPGDPARSVLLERMSRRDAHGMPPLASSVTDTEGFGLIRDWISSVAGC